MGYIFLVIALILNASANILMKLGASRIPVNIKELSFTEIITSIITNYFIIIGIIVFAFNVIFYIASLSKLNLSIAYPIMTAGGFLIISTFSFYYFKEPLTSVQIIGIILMAIGITLVAYNLK